MSTTHNDTAVSQLVLNYIEDKSTFDEIRNSGLNANELYLISNDNTDPLTSVNFTSGTGAKFSYTTEGGTTTDIVTVANLKTSMGLSNVASDGQYTSLTSKPSINGVELSGNKTTTDLGISLNYGTDSITNKPQINGVTLTGNKTTSQLNIDYSDLNNLPTIPTLTSQYVAGNTSNALSAAGVEQALTNYVPKTTSVTGTGALSGGGQLNTNLQITHRNGPTGLSGSAVKVAVDQYGHACLGAAITAEDVNAIPQNFTITNSAVGLNGNYTVIVIFGQQSETMSFSEYMPNGKETTIQYINETENAITLTLPITGIDNMYVNGTKITADYTITFQPNTTKRIKIIAGMIDNHGYSFINII